ncbi:unnamed protein product [Prunus armeniaca]
MRLGREILLLRILRYFRGANVVLHDPEPPAIGQMELNEGESHLVTSGASNEDEDEHDSVGDAVGLAAPSPDTIHPQLFEAPPSHPTTKLDKVGTERTSATYPSHPNASPPHPPPFLAGICENPAGFTHNFTELVRVIPATKFFELNVLAGFGHRFRQLPVIFRGLSKNKSDSKWGFTPRVGSLAGGLEFFRPPEITQGTHALPARAAARGPDNGLVLCSKMISWSSEVRRHSYNRVGIRGS